MPALADLARRGLVAPLASALVLVGALTGVGVALSNDETVTPSETKQKTTETAKPEDAGISFGAESYAWSGEDVDKGRADVEIVSERFKEAPVDLFLTLRGPVGGGEAAPTVDDRVSVPSVIVPRAGRAVAIVKFAEGAEQLDPGTYTGRIAANVAGEETLLHVPVTLTIAGTDGAVTPKPLADKLTVQAVRWVPFFDSTVRLRQAFLPLDPSVDQDVTAKALAIQVNKVLGGLPGDQGGVASVVFSGDVEKLHFNDLAALELEARNFDGPGKYAGTIDLIPGDDEAGDVELTIVTKDSIISVVLALMVGIGAALWARRWRGVGRPLALLERRVVTATGDYAKALEGLKTAADKKPWATYTSLESFSARAKALADNIAGAKTSSYDELAPEQRKALVDELAALEAHIEEIKKLNETAAELEKKLDEVAALDPVESLLAVDPGAGPGFVGRGRDLLQGKAPSVKELTKIIAEMRATRDVADWWLQTQPVVKDDAGWLQKLDAKGVKTDEAKGELHGAWTDLWQARDAAAVSEKDLQKRLTDAHVKVRKLLYLLEPELRAEFVREEGGMDAEAQVAVPDLRGPMRLRALVESPEARAAALRVRLVEADFFSTVLAWVAAIYSGLVALYFGKTWGTPSDYLLAVGWGLVTATAIDALALALRQSRGTDVPAEAPK